MTYADKENFMKKYITDENTGINYTLVSDVLKQVDISNVTYSNLSTFSDMQLSVGILAYVKNTSGASASFTAEIVPQTNANMYVYVKSASSDNATITADGFSKTFDTDDGYIIDLGERTPEETVYVDVPTRIHPRAEICQLHTIKAVTVIVVKLFLHCSEIVIIACVIGLVLIH